MKIKLEFSLVLLVRETPQVLEHYKHKPTHKILGGNVVSGQTESLLLLGKSELSKMVGVITVHLLL